MATRAQLTPHAMGARAAFWGCHHSHTKRSDGAGRVEAVLAASDSQCVAVDLDVLESALSVFDLDASVERAVEQSGVDAQVTRWGRALDSLPRFMFEAVLQAMRSEYGMRAQEILASPWSQD